MDTSTWSSNMDFLVDYTSDDSIQSGQNGDLTLHTPEQRKSLSSIVRKAKEKEVSDNTLTSHWELKDYFSDDGLNDNVSSDDSDYIPQSEVPRNMVTILSELAGAMRDVAGGDNSEDDTIEEAHFGSTNKHTLKTKKLSAKEKTNRHNRKHVKGRSKSFGLTSYSVPVSAPKSKEVVTLEKAMQIRKKALQKEIDSVNAQIFDLDADDDANHQRLMQVLQTLKDRDNNLRLQSDPTQSNITTGSFSLPTSSSSLSHLTSSPSTSTNVLGSTTTPTNVDDDSETHVPNGTQIQPVQVEELTSFEDLLDYCKDEDGTMSKEKLNRLWDMDGLDLLMPTLHMFIPLALGCRVQYASMKSDWILNATSYRHSRTYANWVQLTYGGYNLLMKVGGEVDEGEKKRMLELKMSGTQNGFSRSDCRGHLARVTGSADTTTLMRALHSIGVTTVRVIAFGQKMPIYENPSFFDCLNEGTEEAHNILGDDHDNLDFFDIGFCLRSPKLFLTTVKVPPGNHNAEHVPIYIQQYQLYNHLSENEKPLGHTVTLKFNDRAEACPLVLAANISHFKFYNYIVHIIEKSTKHSFEKDVRTHEQVDAQFRAVEVSLDHIADIAGFEKYNEAKSVNASPGVRQMQNSNTNGLRIEFRKIKCSYLNMNILNDFLERAKSECGYNLMDPFVIFKMIEPLREQKKKIIKAFDVKDWHTATKSALRIAHQQDIGTGRCNTSAGDHGRLVAGDLSNFMGINYFHSRTAINGTTKRWFKPQLIQELAPQTAVVTDRDFADKNWKKLLTVDEKAKIVEVGSGRRVSGKWEALHKEFMTSFGWPDDEPNWCRKNAGADRYKRYSYRLSQYYRNNCTVKTKSKEELQDGDELEDEEEIDNDEEE